jgi:hypothetical protein
MGHDMLLDAQEVCAMVFLLGDIEVKKWSAAKEKGMRRILDFLKN